MADVTDCCVLVCGGGNAAQVVTGLLATRYKTIGVSFFADEAARWKKALGNDNFELTIEGAAVSKIVSKPADITNDPKVASQADVIILAVPSFAHGEYFEKFAPYMKKGTIVGVMPSRSGGDILFASKLGPKAKDMVFMGFETLTWACRFSEWGRKATILGTKNNILAAVTPTSAARKSISKMQGLLGVFPDIIESPNNLSISLRNPGMVVHPGVMYGRWSPEVWDGKAKAEKPLFYQGVDDFTETVLLGMTDEVQAVCRKMEKLVPGLSLKDACTLKQWYLDSTAAR
jgi:ketopantoate reductase